MKIVEPENMFYSFVIPAFNEEESLLLLYQKIYQALEDQKIDDYEIIFIDDGSSDSSWEVIEKLHDMAEGKVRGFQFRRNFGKQNRPF